MCVRVLVFEKIFKIYQIIKIIMILWLFDQNQQASMCVCVCGSVSRNSATLCDKNIIIIKKSKLSKYLIFLILYFFNLFDFWILNVLIILFYFSYYYCFIVLFLIFLILISYLFYSLNVWFVDFTLINLRGGAIIIICRKNVISPELNICWISDRPVWICPVGGGQICPPPPNC